MKKLIKVIALRDEYMEDGEQFCTEGNEYKVIEQDTRSFAIIDDEEEVHYFYFNDCNYFQLIYE